MLRPCFFSFASAVLLSAGLIGSACADEIADKGRDILDRNQHAVVTVGMVIKMKYSLPGVGARDNEEKAERTGTVVDPSGLTVVSLSECEPENMMEGLFAGMSDGEDEKFKMETELTDLKLLLEDGTEVPADIVLRDKDLDLAFIRPRTKPSAPMTALDLTKSGKARVLDQVITLDRLGRSAGRAYAASVERIGAVVQKPRLFYIPAAHLSATRLGSPAFTLDGNILGVFVLRPVNPKSGGSDLADTEIERVTSIILPAADVLKAARQAPESRGDEKPKDGVGPKGTESKAGESKETKSSSDASKK